MIPSLLEPDLKRQWALKHLQGLKQEIDYFCENNLYEIKTEEDAETGQYAITLIHPNIMKAIGAVLMFGDFVGTLHTCLDYIASQLVLQNGSALMTSNAFPICGRNNHKGRERFQRATIGMSHSAIAVIESFQPYHQGGDFKLSPLWRLSTMCNIQKHRHIAAFAAKPPWQFCLRGDQNREGWYMGQEQIDNRTIFRLPLAAKDFVEFNPEGVKTKLRFVDDNEGIDVGYEDLDEIYNFVSDKVLPAFAGFFPDPSTLWYTPSTADLPGSGT